MRRRTFKHLALAAFVSSFSFTAFAVAPGFYIGLQGGYATNAGKPVTVNTTGGGTTTGKPRSNQFAGRVFLGYKVVPYAGWETGLTWFSTISYSIPAGTTACGGSSTKIFVGTWDTTAKIGAPLGPLDVYAKGGVAVNYMVQSAAIGDPQLCSKSFHQYTFGPAVGVGVDWALTQNFVVDVSANRFGVGSPVSYMTFYALGISYHFVDKYCGQFLCDD